MLEPHVNLAFNEAPSAMRSIATAKVITARADRSVNKNIGMTHGRYKSALQQHDRSRYRTYTWLFPHAVLSGESTHESCLLIRVVIEFRQNKNPANPARRDRRLAEAESDAEHFAHSPAGNAASRSTPTY